MKHHFRGDFEPVTFTREQILSAIAGHEENIEKSRVMRDKYEELLLDAELELENAVAKNESENIIRWIEMDVNSRRQSLEVVNKIIERDNQDIQSWSDRLAELEPADVDEADDNAEINSETAETTALKVEVNYEAAKSKVRLEYDKNGNEIWSVYGTIYKKRVVNCCKKTRDRRDVAFIDWERADAETAARILSEYGLTTEQFAKMQDAEEKVKVFSSWEKIRFTAEYVLEIGSADETTAAEYREYLSKNEKATVEEIDDDELKVDEPEVETAAIVEVETENVGDLSDRALAASNSRLRAFSVANEEKGEITAAPETKLLEMTASAKFKATLENLDAFLTENLIANKQKGEGYEVHSIYQPSDIEWLMTFAARVQPATLEKIKTYAKNHEVKIYGKVDGEWHNLAKNDITPATPAIETAQPPIDSDTVITALGTLALSALTALFNVVKTPAESAETATVADPPESAPIEKPACVNKLNATRDKIAKAKETLKKNTRRLMKLDAKVHGLGTELDFFSTAFNSAVGDSAAEIDELAYIASQISVKLAEKTKAEVAAVSLRSRIEKASARLVRLEEKIISAA